MTFSTYPGVPEPNVDGVPSYDPMVAMEDAPGDADTNAAFALFTHVVQPFRAFVVIVAVDPDVSAVAPFVNAVEKLSVFVGRLKLNVGLTTPVTEIVSLVMVEKAIADLSIVAEAPVWVSTYPIMLFAAAAVVSAAVLVQLKQYVVPTVKSPPVKVTT